MAHGYQFIECAGVPRHADKFILEGLGHVLVSGKENLMNGAVVAGHVTDEAFHHIGRQTADPIQPAHVEEISRMLPVQGGDQFAAVDLGGGQHERAKLCCEKIAGGGDQAVLFHRQNSTPEDIIDLDLDLALLPFHKELDSLSLVDGGDAGLLPLAETVIKLPSLTKPTKPTKPAKPAKPSEPDSQIDSQRLFRASTDLSGKVTGSSQERYLELPRSEEDSRENSELVTTCPENEESCRARTRT